MIEMETGTWEGLRFIKSRPVVPSEVAVSKALADYAKRQFGLPVMDRKAIHQQELNKLNRRRY